MRAIYIVLIFIFYLHLSVAQSSWSDDFSNGNFTSNPTWMGDTAKWMVNPQFQLQLNDTPQASSAKLYTASEAVLEGEWEWYARMHFNPSSNNYARAIFAGNDTLGNFGYAVEMGGTTSDQIFLVKYEGGQRTVLAQTSPDFLDFNDNEFKVKVTRNAAGTWELFADYGPSGTYTSFGTAADTSLPFSSHYFLLECFYTATRSDRFYFDDISVNGTPYVDTIAPKISAAQITNYRQAFFDFSKPMDTVLPLGTVMQNTGITHTLSWQTNQRLWVAFAEDITSGDYSFYLDNFFDEVGNALADTNVELSFFPPQPGDLLITEIMYNATPAVNLPEALYLEIFNNTQNPIELEGFELRILQNSYTLSRKTLEPGEYLLLVRNADTALFSAHPKMGLSLPSNFLRNSGAGVSLVSPLGDVTDALYYLPTWHDSPNKTGGGWSLERTSLLVCNLAENWRSSQHPDGGTPGRENSVSGQFVPPPPQVSGFYLHQDTTLEIRLTHPIQLHELDAFSIIPAPTALTLDPYERNRVYATWDFPPEEFAISGESLQGCAHTAGKAFSFSFPSPKEPEEGDLYLNEILPEPYSGGERFYELYNPGPHSLLASRIRVGAFDAQDRSLSNPRQPVSEPLVILPNEYLVFTPSIAGVEAFYETGLPHTLAESNQMPSLPSGSGNLALANASLQIMDGITYGSENYSPMLRITEGISLEKTRPERTYCSNCLRNASSSADFATPGLPNSQKIENVAEGKIHLPRKKFSPNNDGHEDQLEIHLSLEGGSNVRVRVFTEFGHFITDLTRGYLTGAEDDVLVWDGRNDGGQLSAVGIYILVVEVTEPNGSQWTKKLPVLLQA